MPTTILNLDTHIVVHVLAGSLTPGEMALMRGRPWGISAIVLFELAKLVQRGRLELDLGSPDVDRLLGRMRIWPLDLAVCRQSTALDFHSDPADELIAATSIVHGAPLVTRDQRIRSSRMVPLAT